jgi:PD-(D/E)XK nuclease superfamily
VITPRATRLVRVPDLQTMHAIVGGIAMEGDPLDAATRAVLVPTRGAGEAFRRTLETLLLERLPHGAFVLPAFLTRDDLYGRLHESLPDLPRQLTEFEREVLFRRAARVAADSGAPAPFRLRSGLIVAILAFYDELRRRDKTVDDFDRLMTESLASSVEIDRGAERMMRQTRFLTAAFREFERSVADSGAIDEHALRTRLIESASPVDLKHVIVTISDQAADPRGLWTADFDMLARIPGITRLDIVATESLLAAGFHQRVHDLMPGIDEVRHTSVAATPVLVAPQADLQSSAVWFTLRDREQELADVATRIKTGRMPQATAVVFQRPLPYLYLARNVFADAELQYEALDSLPLASEPFAAALDLVFTTLLAEGTRAALIELLASPHWRFELEPGGAVLTRDDVRAADIYLRKIKYIGGWDRLGSLIERVEGRAGRAAAAALSVAVQIGTRLQAIGDAPSASQQIAALQQFVVKHEHLPDPADAWFTAHMRARGAVLGALRDLREAHERHDDQPVSVAELAGTIHRWIEGQTFSPRTGAGGVVLLDSPAAAYADAHEVRITGLIEPDWPERHGRSIFYPASLLSQLGWPAEADRQSAARARFHDLLRLARARVSVSTFTLEDDAIVPPSAFLEDVSASGLTLEREVPIDVPRVFLHEALSEEPLLTDAFCGEPAAWLGVRSSRPAAQDDRFRGSAGPRTIDAHAVSHVERYLDCPFKYFATHVLRLEEERPDQSGLTPQERGQLLHDVFERFFRAWHQAGHRAIEAGTLPQALVLFEQIAEERLAALGEADRALERTYLLGSAVAPGLAERAFAFEIEHGVQVVERLLEYPLEGEFEFKVKEQSRSLTIRAKADRIDLLADGTLRVVDYKLGRAPKPARALQLPVYGVCASQHLEGRHGRSWTLSRAGYVAFRERNAFVPLGSSSSLDAALEDGQQRFLDAVAAIEQGLFPVDPDEPFLCTRCGYAAVCRKDYVGDE